MRARISATPAAVLLSTLGLLAIGQPAAQAQGPAISVNFQGDTGAQPAPNNFINPSDVAGQAPFSNWNNDTGGAQSGQINAVFASNSGNMTVGTTVSYSANDAQNNGLQATYATTPDAAGKTYANDPNLRLMNGYVRSGPSSFGTPATFTVTAVPASIATYSLYVYAFSGAAVTGSYSIRNTGTGGTALAPAQTVSTLATFNGLFSQATATTAGSYILFTGLTARSFTVQALGNNTMSPPNQFLPINGFQIVATPAVAPEPSALVALALGAGALGLLAVRRRAGLENDRA